MLNVCISGDYREFSFLNYQFLNYNYSNNEQILLLQSERKHYTQHIWFKSLVIQCIATDLEMSKNTFFSLNENTE